MNSGNCMKTYIPAINPNIPSVLRLSACALSSGEVEVAAAAPPGIEVAAPTGTSSSTEGGSCTRLTDTFADIG